MRLKGQNLFQSWLRVDPAARPEIYREVYGNADPSSATYWLELLLSAGIATLGLVLNSPAVIIGAMLISPLMGPIMATGLGLSVGDLYLVAKALLNLTASILAAILISAALVAVLPFHSPTQEILSRTNPTILDLCVALLSGLAGSVAVGRSSGSKDGVMTMPGVAIAVALMPPLCTAGFGVGSGFRFGIMRGAGLLFMTNIVAIVFSAFLVFVMLGMNSAEVHAEIDVCRSTEPFADRLARSPLRGLMRNGGQLRWRAVLLVAVLTAVAWPLQAALRQLSAEARAREAVTSIVGALVPADHIMSQQIAVGQQSLAVRVVVEGFIAPALVHHAQEEIAKRAGRQVLLSVQSVASQSELAKLDERLALLSVSAKPAPVAPPPPPPPPSMQEHAAAMLQRVDPALTTVWPVEAPIQQYSLQVSAAGLALQVKYKAPHPLGTIAQEILTHELQTRLEVTDLVLNAVRLPPARTAKKGRRHRRP